MERGLNDQAVAVRSAQFLDSAGHQRRADVFIEADVKAHVACANYRGWTCKHPVATVCWVCGKNRETCLREFGQGLKVLAQTWAWHRQVLPSASPPQRPRDYPLRGCHRVVHNNPTGVQSALMLNNHWSKGRARRWVQMRADSFCVRACTGSPQKDGSEGLKKKGLQVEQGAG